MEILDGNLQKTTNQPSAKIFQFCLAFLEKRVKSGLYEKTTQLGSKAKIPTFPN